MSAAARAEAVVLVNGLWLGGWSMALIAWRLRRRGFRTYLFSYPTVRKSLRDNAAALRVFSDAIDADVVHYVGHSLGGVLICAMLSYCPPPRPGRIVTLAAPHSGSGIARRLWRRRWGKRILGHSIASLLDGEPPIGELGDRSVGVIKGDMSAGFGRVLFPDLRRPNDGVLTFDEMHLPGAADEITLHVAHSGMLLSARAAECVGDFLRHGGFVAAATVVERR